VTEKKSTAYPNLSVLPLTLFPVSKGKGKTRNSEMLRQPQLEGSQMASSNLVLSRELILSLIEALKEL